MTMTSQEEQAGPGLPRDARGAQTPPWRAPGRRQAYELAFDSQKERENYKPRVVSRIKRGRSVRIK